MSENYDCPMCDESFESARSRGMHRRWNHTDPWEKEDKLRELYINERLSIPKIAEKWNCGESTVEQALNEHGIETRDRGGYDGTEPFKDPELLRELYHEEKLCHREIAERLDCTIDEVRCNMESNDIPRRDFAGISKDTPWRNRELLRERLENGDGVDKIADNWGCSPQTIINWKEKHEIDIEHSYYTSNSVPYSAIRGIDKGEPYSIFVHQLVAYAHHGLSLEDIFDPSVHVHHRNEIEWLNNPENLEVVNVSEHAERHGWSIPRHIR